MLGLESGACLQTRYCSNWLKLSWRLAVNLAVGSIDRVLQAD